MPTVNYSYAPGWDSGARTSAGFSGNGSLSFSVGQAIGVVCGLNSANNGQEYTEIQHGFYISGNKYRIVERGVFKTGFAVFAAWTIFKVERINKVVKYYLDDAVVYTSLSLSDGIVFGDCSLFFYLDSIIDATITLLSDYNEAEVILPFGAFGVEGDPNFGAVRLGPLFAAGEEWEVNSAVIEIGPLWGRGAEGDANWGAVGIGPLGGSGAEGLLIPDYNAGSGELGSLYAYGYEGQIDSVTADVTLGPLWGKGAEGDPSWGEGGIGPLQGFGYTLNRRYLYADWPDWTADIRSVVAPLYITSTADLVWPARELNAYGETHDGSAILYWPEKTLTAYGGGSAQLTWPDRELTVQGTIEIVSTAELTWPERTLSSDGFVGGVAEVELIWPDRSLTAYCGGVANLTWPARTVTIESALEIIGVASLTWPQRVAQSFGLAGGVGTANLTWPAPILTSTGLTGGVISATLTWPALNLESSFGTISTETTYAINLSTGAVTQLLLGAFDKLVTAHGRLYGLRNGALVYLGGSTDQGASISVIIRFAPQQFGTYLAKRIDGTVYLNTRENDGVTLTLIEDEVAAWPYQDDADNSPAMGTHPVKVGRGITFHSLGIVVENRDGGGLTLGGIEIPVIPLMRRPL